MSSQMINRILATLIITLFALPITIKLVYFNKSYNFEEEIQQISDFVCVDGSK